jgi:hypothetical protein
MRLSIKAAALACGVLWGGGMLVVATANLTWPGYGVAFLDAVASVYPGYRPGGGLGSVFVGTGYAFLDAAFAGALFAWFYNRFAPETD